MKSKIDPTGKTVWRQALEEVVSDLLEEDKAWYTLLAETQHKQASGFWEPWYVEMFCQKHFGGFDLYDAWAFLQLHYGLASGQIGWCSVYIGEKPGRDADEEGNNAILSRLQEPFGAKFGPGNGFVVNDDGVFWWDETINFAKHNPDTDKWASEPIEKWTLPLEVGSTDVATTFAHMNCGGLARWPYYSKYIQVFHVFDVNEWNGRNKINEQGH
jgi:hypothetical protein